MVLGDALVEQEARAALAKLSGALELRVRFAPNLVALELDTRSFEFGPAATVECHAPRYTELASEVQVSYLVLADRGARAYLATKLELSPRDVCLAVIDEHARFGFVVCERLACVASAARQQHRTPGR
ncbi:MAG: hypothetical protein Q8N26_08235 [Myxococcales bacterium]|nr:hypothetical protein [Myxococcales bacterium]